MSEPVVLVTGGAGNLGRAVTRTFLQNGARVVVPLYKTDTKESLEPLAREFGGRLETFLLDLTTERGADAAAKQVVEWGGRLDAVAHLVGGWFGGVKLADTPVEGWDRMMDLNLKSAYLVARAALPHMVRGGSGALVFVGARAARKNRAGNVAYAASKAGLLALVEGIAEDYRDEGIRSNAVLPGTIDTETNRRAMPDADFSQWTSPAEIARVIHELATDPARSGELVEV
jgi:NAD(P)-dependent dehydrogenase (short-subunit alcohol dehydrogenase family)